MSTKVNVKPGAQAATPSEQIVARAMQEVEIDDARGRKILLRKPGALAQFRLVEAVGNSSTNQGYMAMVMPLIFVASIDGIFVPPLEQKKHVEALIVRLDDDGIAAVHKGVFEHFGESTTEADQEELKKS
jgi:hypothetical protein